MPDNPKPAIDHGKMYHVKVNRVLTLGKANQTVMRPQDGIVLPGNTLASLPEDAVESYEEV